MLCLEVFFATAGHTVLHELTHLDSLAKFAGPLVLMDRELSARVANFSSICKGVLPTLALKALRNLGVSVAQGHPDGQDNTSL